jgi:hypothetical protein
VGDGSGMWAELMLARVVCRFRGHAPSAFFNATATIPGVTLVSECPRCRRMVEQAVPVMSGTALRLVKPKDAA